VIAALLFASPHQPAAGFDAREQRALVRFMEALTDTSGTAGR
jgi:hypothetical protein